MSSILESDFGRDSACVVVGSSGLIGQRLCEDLLRSGLTVVAVDKVAPMSNCEGRRLVPFYGRDISDPGVIDALVHEITREDLVVSGLVVLSGPNPSPANQIADYSLEGLDLERFVLEVEAHFLPVMVCVKAFGPRMACQGGGSIVLVGSDLGLMAPDHSLYEHIPGNFATFKPASYVVAKHGLTGMARYVATFWGKNGVRCNVVAPGPVDSPTMEPKLRAKLIDEIPLGRLASVEEVSSALMFLLSPAASFVNGSVLVVDGGRTIW